MFPRASGILLHPTSLPGPFGIGDLGDDAYRFVDFLAGAGQHLWQMLPLGPTGYGDSPYQCLSAFGGNPMLISPARLVAEGLLDADSLADIPPFPRDRVDFGAVGSFKSSLLRQSFDIFRERAGTDLRSEFASFCHCNVSWLDDLALFMALKQAHGLASFENWEDGIRKHQAKTVAEWKSKLKQEVAFQQYQQFIFFRQWSALREYCAERAVKLIGDIPIFVALDSASVWAHPEMFFLDDGRRPTLVAGVPPDYFSKTGQLWNNPLYRWDVMARDGYAWWVERFRATLAFVDIVRLDHFRGFAKYWEIPAGNETAEHGRWADGPGADLFEKLSAELGEVPIIAEDLGTITPDVIELRERLGYPGMRVLQFAFISGNSDDVHLPHNYPSNCVVYTGTHDNNTTLGWFRGEAAVTTLSEETRRLERERVLKYTGTGGEQINWDLIRLAFMSVADTAIIPLQDILGLGGDSRMNTPGTADCNWSWRFEDGMLTSDLKAKLADLTVVYGR